MKENKSTQFEFLRFLAFTLIFIWHAGIWSFPFLPNDRGAVAGVSFFFILSGFLSGFSSYEKSVRFSVRETLSYVWKKIKRIYPLYFVTGFLLLMFSDIPINIAMHNIPACAGTLEKFARYLLMIQSWFPGGDYFAINRAGWFLSSILPAYLLTIPAKAAATRIRKKQRSGPAFGLLFFILAACTVLYCYLTRNLDAEYYQYIFPVARLGEYFSGMALGYFLKPLCRQMQSATEQHDVSCSHIAEPCVGSQTAKPCTGTCPLTTKPARRLLFTLAELLSLALFLGAMYMEIPYWCYRIVWWLLPIYLVLAVFAAGEGYLSLLFQKKFFVRLGEITMPCFLLNTLVIEIYIAAVGDTALLSGSGKAFALAFTFTATILLSLLIKTN